MSDYVITIDETGESYKHPSQCTLLEGMARSGRHNVPYGCRGGGCGICKIEVLSGTYDKRVMSRAHVSPDDEVANRVLACRIWPTSDLRLKVLGDLKNNSD